MTDTPNELKPIDIPTPISPLPPAKQESEKAHDIDKTDPEYKIKVASAIQKRFAEERLKSQQREKDKREEALRQKGNTKDVAKSSSVPPVSDKAASNVDKNVTNSQPQQVDNRDPEENVKRKDITALVNQLNKSFAVIEAHKKEMEDWKKRMEESFKK
jgi:hypothetical protein